MTTPSAPLCDFARQALEIMTHGRDTALTASLPRLIFITDSAAIPAPESIIASLPPGQIILLRDYHHPARERLAHRLVAAARGDGHYFLVAGDRRLAEAVGADGCHFPQGMAGVEQARAAHPQWLITLSAHSAQAVAQANLSGADAVLLSPLFATESHPGASALGVENFNRLAQKSTLPVFALGGIHAGNLHRCAGLFAHGLAGIRGFMPISP